MVLIADCAARQLSAEDREFLEAFTSCELAKSCWTHQAHIRMAWLQMEQAESYEEALKLIKAGITQFNDSVANVGFHETVTVGFARYINHFRRLDGPGVGWRECLDRHPQLLSREKPLLHAHYTKELLYSQTARDRFVEPDLKPLPAVGSVRMATIEDAADLLSIYSVYVENSAATFEISEPSKDDIENRIGQVLKVAPWLVYIIDGRLVAYAYASRFNEREAYKWSAQVSVYIDHNYLGIGIGKELYATLLRLLVEQGFCSAYGGITLPNAASVSLHESLGFGHVGTYRDVGFKLGKWHDVGWWQKRLRDLDGAPPAMRTPAELGWL